MIGDINACANPQNSLVNAQRITGQFFASSTDGDVQWYYTCGILEV
jgi:hypothetical protein